MLKRIVAVDSSEVLRELYSEILVDEGYTVYLFPYRMLNRQEIQAIDPALMILDAVPGNYTLARQTLQNLRLWQFTFPVLVCTTGTPFVGEFAIGGEDRWLRVLPKPFDIEDLLLVIQTMLLSR
jgi:DNA-binding response OmpR family regulator